MNAQIDVSVTDNFVSFSERTLIRLSAVVRASARKVEIEARKSIRTGTRSGRTYKRGGRTRRASAAGEPPKRDMGNLEASITTEMQPGALEAQIVADEEYAADLEYGTRHMAARPFMAPAIEKIRPHFLSECRRVMGEEA